MRRKRAVRAALVWVSVGLVGVLFTSVAAASSVAKSSGTGAKVTKVRSSSSPFVVAETVGVEKLDPDVTTGYPDFQALGLIYDQLVQYNSKLQIVPDLATSWKLSNGARAITFQLRRGVKFDDGSCFTSADVVASLHRVLAPKTGDAAVVVPVLCEVDRRQRSSCRRARSPQAGLFDLGRTHLTEPLHPLDEGNQRRDRGERSPMVRDPTSFRAGVLTTSCC